MNLKEYFAAQAVAASNLDEEKISEFARVLGKLRESNATLWIAGNGGSAATASHAVADFTKTSTSNGHAPVKAIALSELLSLTTAFSNDVSFEASLGESLALLSSPGDALLIITVSGLSPNLRYAADVAKRIGIPVYSLTGSRGHQMIENSTLGILVESNDYQIVENIHLEIIHWLVKALS